MTVITDELGIALRETFLKRTAQGAMASTGAFSLLSLSKKVDDAGSVAETSSPSFNSEEKMTKQWMMEILIVYSFPRDDSFSLKTSVYGVVQY